MHLVSLVANSLRTTALYQSLTAHLAQALLKFRFCKSEVVYFCNIWGTICCFNVTARTACTNLHHTSTWFIYFILHTHTHLDQETKRNKKQLQENSLNCSSDSKQINKHEFIEGLFYIIIYKNIVYHWLYNNHWLLIEGMHVMSR